MEFADTNEQAQLREGVRRFAARTHPFRGGRQPFRVPIGDWKEVAANGWTGLGLPEEAGGIGLAPIETAIVLEEFGRGLVVEPLVSRIVLAARAVSLLGSPAQRAMLGQVVSGDLRLAFAYEEDSTRGDPSQVASRAERVADGWRLSGRKLCVTGAADAETLVVVARTSGNPGDKAGLSLFLVPSRGAERADYLTVDGYDATDFDLDGAIVPADAILGAEGGAGPVVDDLIDLGLIALSAEAVGIMDRALQLTRDYAKLRRQFGQPIGSFQAVQYRLADMLVELEMSRSSLAAALAGQFGGDRVARSRAASGCKSLIGRAGRFVCENAIQLHGGIGMADEVEVGHHYRRLLAIETTLGNSDYHLQRYAALG